jgi:hypothetical protein
MNIRNCDSTCQNKVDFFNGTGYTVNHCWSRDDAWWYGERGCGTLLYVAQFDSARNSFIIPYSVLANVNGINCNNTHWAMWVDDEYIECSAVMGGPRALEFESFRYAYLAMSKLGIAQSLFIRGFADSTNAIGDAAFESFFNGLAPGDFQLIESGWQHPQSAPAQTLAAARRIMTAWNTFLGSSLTPAEIARYNSYKQDAVDYANAFAAMSQYLALNGKYAPLGFQEYPSLIDDVTTAAQYFASMRQVTANIRAYMQGEGALGLIDPDDPTESPVKLPVNSGVTVEGPVHILNGATGITVASSQQNYQLAAPNNGGNAQLIQGWNISLVPAGTQPTGLVTVYVPIPSPQGFENGQPKAGLAIFDCTPAIPVPVPGAAPQQIGGTWYMVFQTNHFSDYALAVITQDTPPGTDDSWWAGLPSFVQFILKYLFFGWIWMK